MKDRYAHSIEEGLSLALLRKHSRHEVEAVLHHLYGQDRTKTILKKIFGFQEAING